jgi:hypothetical protein
MPFTGTFKIGPFHVDPEGCLSLAHADVSPGFCIRWRGRTVHARLLHTDDRDGHLILQSSLGRIPSSASDPAKRLRCFAMLKTLLTQLPRTWCVRLLPDHQPQLEVESTIDLPITATKLVTELTEFLLVLSPYLDLMDQAGLAAPANGPTPV